MIASSCELCQGLGTISRPDLANPIGCHRCANRADEVEAVIRLMRVDTLGRSVESLCSAVTQISGGGWRDLVDLVESEMKK